MPAVRTAAISHGRMVRLALPMTLAHLSTPLLGLADAAVIGRLGQADLLGAMAAAAVLFDFVFWSFGFLRMGTAGLAAQAFGKGDVAEERATLVRALLLALVIGACLILLQAPIAWIGFGALSGSDAVTAAARSYFDIRIWSAPFTLANYAVLGALLGRGRTGVALALQVAINLGNIALNVAFVYALGLGVRGSAAGTLLAEAAGAAIGLLVLRRLLDARFAVDRHLLFDAARVRRMFAVNRDIMIRTAALIFAFAFFTAQGARGGDVILAANAVLMNLFLTSAYFLDGFATAAEQMCGQSLGAGDAAGFRRAVFLALLWCLVFAAGVSALAFVGGGAFVDLVTTNTAVRDTARGYLPFAALAPFAGAMAFAFDGIFIGATWTRDMRNMMMLALAVYLASFVALRGFGNAGLWSALLLFLAARGAGQAWRYRGLLRQTFPTAQSSAAAPVASAKLG